MHFCWILECYPQFGSGQHNFHPKDYPKNIWKFFVKLKSVHTFPVGVGAHLLGASVFQGVQSVQTVIRDLQDESTVHYTVGTF